MLVRYAESVGIGFFKPLCSVRPFTEWPLAGFLEPKLAEKILVERPFI